MWLVAGLGNPGPSYAGHRHSVGFMLLDAVAQAYAAPSWSSKSSALITQTTVGSETLLLCKPQTFMNHSGQAVGELCRYYRIPPEQVLVCYDELDLVFGKIRIKMGGGAGGHNGIRDIDRHIDPNYWRLRFGIGHPGHKDRVHGYVLSNFTTDERIEVGRLADIIAAALPIFFTQGHEALMTKIALASAPQ